MSDYDTVSDHRATSPPLKRGREEPKERIKLYTSYVHITHYLTGHKEDLM